MLAWALSCAVGGFAPIEYDTGWVSGAVTASCGTITYVPVPGSMSMQFAESAGTVTPCSGASTMRSAAGHAAWVCGPLELSLHAARAAIAAMEMNRRMVENALSG